MGDRVQALIARDGEEPEGIGVCQGTVGEKIDQRFVRERPDRLVRGRPRLQVHDRGFEILRDLLRERDPARAGEAQRLKARDRIAAEASGQRQGGLPSEHPQVLRHAVDDAREAPERCEKEGACRRSPRLRNGRRSGEDHGPLHEAGEQHQGGRKAEAQVRVVRS